MRLFASLLCAALCTAACAEQDEGRDRGTGVGEPGGSDRVDAGDGEPDPDACACDATPSACNVPPFETTCRFGGTEPVGSTEWSSADTGCSDAITCDGGQWSCPAGAVAEGARVCGEACRLYAEANPGCTCITDTFGYEARIDCR